MNTDSFVKYFWGGGGISNRESFSRSRENNKDTPELHVVAALPFVFLASAPPVAIVVICLLVLGEGSLLLCLLYNKEK